MTNEKADQKIESEHYWCSSEQNSCLLQYEITIQQKQIVRTLVNPVGVGLLLSDALVSFLDKMWLGGVIIELS